MLRKRNKKIVSCRPNVIPILDAVFIFIFFLLMSAQFLEIHEIGSDAPAVRTIAQNDKDKRPPLNLALKITPEHIYILTGIDGKMHAKIKRSSPSTMQTLKMKLIDLKEEHPHEESVILKPEKKVPFKDIVLVMDTVRAYESKNKDLFSQVIFETIQ